jgi:hypothetical protein
MQVREQALIQGLQVKVCDLPQSYRAKVRLESAAKGVVYRLEWQDKLRRNTALNILVMREKDVDQYDALDDNENIVGLKNTLNESLQRMPEDVMAVEYSALGLGVFWREKGTKEQVVFIKQELERLRDLIV